MKNIYVANWKMNCDLEMIDKFSFQMDKLFQWPLSNINLIICPPACYLSYCIEKFNKYKFISIGSQNCHDQNNGPFTGEISPIMLTDIGCKYVILGHTERRAFEDNIIIRNKINAAINFGLKVILCIGSTNKDVISILDIKNQIILSNNINKNNCIIAYEPIWAIGTNQIPNNMHFDQAYNIISSICDFPIIYGGSVNRNSICDLSKFNSHLSGFLIGNASLDIKHLYDIIKHHELS